MNGFYDEFRDTIGEVLGISLAMAEHDLRQDDNADEALRSIERIAAVYQSFSVGALKGFKEDFEAGYERGKAELRADNEATARIQHPAAPSVDFTPG